MRKFNYILAGLLFILIIPLGEATGIAGDDLNFRTVFVPGGTFTYEYYAIATTDRDLLLVAEGDFAEYVTFSTERLSARKGHYIPFEVTINLPQDTETGGHGIRICVEEASPAGQGAIKAKTKSCAVIKFIRLYPGKYIEAELNFPNGNVDDSIKSIIKVKSWGEEKINELSGEIDIYEDDKKITTINTDTVSLESTKDVNLEAYLDTKGMSKGIYIAKGRVKYDGETKELEEEKFNLGELSVVIENYTKEVESDKINEFRILVRSEWNSKIVSIYANVDVLKDGQEVTSFKTAPESLDPWKRINLLGYLNTEDMDLGKYDVKIDAIYEDTETSLSGQIEVVESISEEKPTPSAMESDTTLIIAISLVIVMLIIIAVISAKHAKKKR